MLSSINYIPLPDRGLITLSGPDRRKFVQGLITNDIERLNDEPSIYACFLSHNGRFLHDFIIFEREDTLYLDCEGGARAEDLLARLQKFKLRAQITLNIVTEKQVYALFAAPDQLDMFTYPDPRHPEMGLRAGNIPDNAAEGDFADWDRQRIKCAIPDGSRDMIIEKSTMMESNIDDIGGISWTKGCYVGQELTARTNYRGLVKKKLYPVRFEKEAPEPLTDLRGANNEKLGQMRSSCGDIGLALLRKDQLDKPDLPFTILATDS